MCFWFRSYSYFFQSRFSCRLQPNLLNCIVYSVIFKVYDVAYNGKVTYNDILEVLQDLTGSFTSDDKREVYNPIFHCYLIKCVHNMNEGLASSPCSLGYICAWRFSQTQKIFYIFLSNVIVRVSTFSRLWSVFYQLYFIHSSSFYHYLLIGPYENTW